MIDIFLMVIVVILIFLFLMVYIFSKKKKEKPEVKDIQITPAENIIKKLKELGAKIKIYDPFFKSTNIFEIDTENNIELCQDNIEKYKEWID